MVAKNICKTCSFKNKNQQINWESFNVRCGCGSDDHQHDLIVEYDKELKSVILHLYFKTRTSNLYKFNPGLWGFLKDLWQGIAFRIGCLFKGYNTLNYEFIFADEESIQDYINALQESVNKVKQDKAVQEKPNDISTALNKGN